MTDDSDLLFSKDKHERKTTQLCAQVQEALSLALAECDNPVLQSLMVEAVEPAPNALRLRVEVSECVADNDRPLNEKRVKEALRKARAYLRHQIASEINRKKVPELTFHVVPNWEGKP